MFASDKIPGVYLEEARRPATEPLPRMDIAGFVGFASMGPVDTPVPCEDVAQFRAVFGDDPELAWDPVLACPQQGYLGSAVESFFNSGGARCWVVRVADRTELRARVLEMPWLSITEGGRMRSAVGWARSAGSWASDLEIRTRLTRVPLPVLSVELANGTITLELGVAPGQVRQYDLLELRFPPAGPTVFQFVGNLEEGPAGLRVEGREHHWFRDVVDSPIACRPGDQVGPAFERLQATEGEAQYRLLWANAPGSGRPQVYLLSFEIQTLRGGVPAERIDRLAFHADHPRFWGLLPSDRVLFAGSEERTDAGRSTEIDKLWQQARVPRFPLAGDDGNPSGGNGSRARTSCLPLSGDDPLRLLRMPGLLPPSTRREVAGPLEWRGQDGLSTFSASMFLDDELASLSSASLWQRAMERCARGERVPQGIYSLVPLEEVSLICVPDAVHRPWRPEPRNLDGSLEAPEVDPVKAPGADGRYQVTWKPASQVAGRDTIEYLAQWSTTPDFDTPGNLYRGNRTRAAGVLANACEQATYVRVRAEVGGTVGPWSITRIVQRPEPEFGACKGMQISEIVLSLWGEEPSGDRYLSWSAQGNLSPPGVEYSYELEAADDVLFRSAVKVANGAETDYRVPPIHGVKHYRVRQVSGQVKGPWSNTLRVSTAEPSPRSLAAPERCVPGAEPGNTDLIAVHRAMLRLGQARGDLIALLTLPRHYEAAVALQHLGWLSAKRGRTEESTATADFAAKVRPLTPGERSALRFGAVFHPWLAFPTQSGASDTYRVAPPDGAVAGHLARRALEGGAWLAAANMPFTRGLALEPVICDGEWAQLTQAGINVVREEPRGFVVLGGDTLSPDPECRPIHVRRLLSLLRRLVLQVGEIYVFEGNSEDLRGRVRSRFERELSYLHAKGALAGSTPDSAYRVNAGPSINTAQSIDQGRLIVELQVAPAQPLAFLSLRLVQRGAEELTLLEA